MICSPGVEEAVSSAAARSSPAASGVQPTARTCPNAVRSWLVSQTGHRTDLASLEIQLAVADAKCGYSVGLEQAYSARFRWHADHLPASDRGALLSIYQIRQRSIARAKRLLGLDNG